MPDATLVERLKAFLLNRRYQYHTTFNCPPGQAVLKDLARFCFANKSTFQENDRTHALAEGRREVWLRIANHLNLSPDQLWQLYDGRDE